MFQSNEHTPSGEQLLILLPDPDHIEQPLVRAAAERAAHFLVLLQDARRERNAAHETIAKVRAKTEDGAARTMIETGERLPRGVLRKELKEAEETHKEAVIEADAAATAYVAAYRNLSATIDANADAWRETLLKDAARSLKLLASARKSVEAAAASAVQCFGLLDMLAHNDMLREMNGSGSRPIIGEAPAGVYTGVALENLGEAIARTNRTLEGYVRG